MLGDIFRGQLVRLAAQDPEADSEAQARWSLDSEYLRLLDSDPARPRTSKQWQDDSAKRAEPCCDVGSHKEGLSRLE